jgi:hypothetical protein
MSSFLEIAFLLPGVDAYGPTEKHSAEEYYKS